MRFFFLLDFQHWVLSVILGVVLALLVYLGFTAYQYAQERADRRAEQEFRYPDGLRGKNFPTPAFILFLYFGFVVWTICYMVFVGIRGGPI